MHIENYILGDEEGKIALVEDSAFKQSLVGEQVIRTIKISEWVESRAENVSLKEGAPAPQ